jgi:excisionase family DNA binding protein
MTPSTYTAREAATRLGVSEWTIRRRIADGSLPRLALAGRVLRLPARVVDAIADGTELEEAK